MCTFYQYQQMAILNIAWENLKGKIKTEHKLSD